MPYGGEYDNPSIRVSSSKALDVTLPYLNDQMTLVDLGCGTCAKTMRLSSHVRYIIGVDNDEGMLQKAHKNIIAAGVRNIKLVHGDNLNTPFASQSIDVCTAFLTSWTSLEVFRILKKEGVFIAEVLCADDKLEMKRAFGKDEYGWRGRFLNQSNEEHKELLLRSMRGFFEIQRLEEYKRETILSREGFFKLLEVTPTIRNFPSGNDATIFEELTPQGHISFTESRAILIARPYGMRKSYET